MVWSQSTSCGRETDKIRYDAWLYVAGQGLDIGCGTCKVAPHATGIDILRVGAAPIADIAADGRRLPTIASASLDFVYSSHFLEHVVDYEATLAEWWRVLKVGGKLILYLPHRDFYPRIGQSGSNTDHKHDFHPDDIKQAMWRVTKSTEDANFDVLEDEDRNNGNEYSFFQVFRKCEERKGQYDPWVLRRQRLASECIRTVCISRYGAVGDNAFIASVAALYKRNGWYVVVHTSPLGVELLRHDNNIDELHAFEMDGLYFSGTLEPFWHHLSRRYDRFVNLTQSVEGNLLPGPEHTHHSYPLDVRQRLLSVSYMERTHDIAGMHYDWSGMVFRATEAEMHSAKLLIEAYNRPLVGICLAGSGHHKVYPFQHMAVARLMLETDCSVVLFGGPDDLSYEELVVQTALALGISDKRLVRTCKDKWSIRKALSVSQQCDVLFGPETGLLQWNAMELNHKIVMLSHSSEENLIKHWTNAVALRHQTPCGPCHRKHNDWTWCNRGGSGYAACMEFPVNTIVEALHHALVTKEATTLRSHTTTRSDKDSNDATDDEALGRQFDFAFATGDGTTQHAARTNGAASEEATSVVERIAAHNAETRQSQISE